MSNQDWKEVTEENPCPICGHSSWCRKSLHDETLICQREKREGAIERIDVNAEEFYLYPDRKNNSFHNKNQINHAKVVIERGEPEFLHKVYSKFIEKLSLSHFHRENLKKRGFTDMVIDMELYRTAITENLDKICSDLFFEFGKSIQTVPGFQLNVDKNSAQASVNIFISGILIPIFNEHTQIISIKIRTDNENSHRKYTYLSSSFHQGPSASKGLHISKSSKELLEKDSSTIGITEGEFKATLASIRLGFPIISIPGVSSWKSCLPFIEKFFVKKVKLYFDSDYKKNSHVLKSLVQLSSTLHLNGVFVIGCFWNNFNGIDDALLHNEPIQERTGVDLQNFLNTIISDHKLPDFSWKEGSFIEASAANEKLTADINHDFWKDPLPLPDPKPKAPILSIDKIPFFLRDWVEDCSCRIQAPPEFFITPLLVSFSILIGRQVGIRPKRFDPWTVICNLWGMIVGPPSAMKSPAQKEAFKFLDHFSKEFNQDFDKKSTEWAANEACLLAKKKGFEDKIKLSIKNGKPNDIPAIKADLLELEIELKEKKPIARRLRTSDATQEILGVLARDNPNGLGIITDELVTIFKNSEKQGREGERAFLLGGWPGDGKHTVDRVGRGHIEIPSYCLSIFGNIQPGVLNSLFEESKKRGNYDDGLIQRFQLMVFPELDKKWVLVDRPPNESAQKKIFEVSEKLLKLDLQLVGAKQEPKADLPYINFSPEAQTFFNCWLTQLETRLRNDSLSESLECHLAKYRSLMPSLALIFHLVECVGGDKKTDAVSCENARLAAYWCDFLEGHAKKIYSISENAQFISSNELLQKIKNFVVTDQMPIREIYRKNWKGLGSLSKVNEAVSTLEEFGWARLETLNMTGGAPSSVIRIHPNLRK